MLKKLIAMVLVATMTMSLGSGALAAESVSYEPYSDSVTTPEEQDQHEKEFFEHRYLLVTVNGVTRQETVDKTAENGISAYKADNSTHFNDNTFISQKSQELYLKRVQTGVSGMYDERWV